MSEENRKIIDILDLLLFDNSPGGIKLIPFIVLNKKLIDDSDFSVFEIQSVLRKLERKNYLKKWSIEDFKKDSTGEIQRVAEMQEKHFLDLDIPPREYVKSIEKKLKEVGIRMKNHDCEKHESIFEHKDMDKEIGETFEEEMLKNKIITVHRILGDLFKLLKDIKNGRDFDSIQSNYVDLYYKKNTSELFIQDEGPIKINKISTRKTQDDQLLSAIMKRGKEKTHYFLELMKEKVIKGATSQDYFDICKSIKKKIEKQTPSNISDFLIISRQYVKINPKYYKKLPQLTLEIT
jgi:uncharacterized protein (UPF0262 family)